MQEDVRQGQVWESKNSGRRCVICSEGPQSDTGSGRRIWQWVREGQSPEHGTHLISERILFEDYILVKEAP